MDTQTSDEVVFDIVHQTVEFQLPAMGEVIFETNLPGPQGQRGEKGDPGDIPDYDPGDLTIYFRNQLI